MPAPASSTSTRTGGTPAADLDRGHQRSNTFTDRLPGLTLAALRVISALVLMTHATQRTFGFPANLTRPFGGAPDPFTRPWFTTIIELSLGTLLLLGLFTRPVAFVLSGLMAFAYFLVHFPRAFFPITNGGEPAVLLCFVFLYLAAAGAGPYSLDGVLRRRSGRS